MPAVKFEFPTTPAAGSEPPPEPRRPFPGREAWIWPRAGDARIPFALILTLYAVLGCTVLGFNRNPFQIFLTTSSGCLLDVLLAYMLRGRRVIPLSAYITSLSLALLLNYSHNYYLLFFPVLLAIGSKYVLTFQGRHVFNPSMFGVAVSLLVTRELITAAPAYQWGGALAMSLFIVMAAGSCFAFRIGRTPLIVSFLGFYTLQTALRAYIMRHHLPPETLFLGTLTSAPFFIFTFYMITDPQTSPKSARGQVLMAFCLTLVDLYLHKLQSVYTYFYAALIVASCKFAFLHLRELAREGVVERLRNSVFDRQWLKAAALIGSLGLAMQGLYHGVMRPQIAMEPLNFTMEALPPSRTGIHSRSANLFQEVDPRLRHIVKWILSVGAAVAVGDFDRDGLVDLFFTNPLQRAADRNALYRNRGDFRFERVPLPALEALSRDPKQLGLSSAAVFVDYDSDGDLDLFVSTAFGSPHLLKSLLRETGRPKFIDVSREAGLEDYTISVAATFLDFDRDGRLDLLVGNAMAPYLPGYDRPTMLNIFRLPQPQYPGDRRMFNFMHNGWHNADNGGLNLLYRNQGDGRFRRLDIAALGMPETHWTIAVGTGDLNQDGWTDLYLASDFGHDDLYLNRRGERFERIQGKMFGDVGLDTYKGMNSSLADFDGNGFLDIYVSNVHHALQAEGSLLWMTYPGTDRFMPVFTDEATLRGALNENRFGWGAATEDVNNDGWIDIVQANGMVDDRLDRLYDGCPDYWYVNHKLMQSGPEIHTYADMWGDLRGRCIYPNEARRLYLNRGDRERLQFVDVAEQAGLADPDNSRGVALVDLDNDGALDVVITNQHGPASIYRNTLYSGPRNSRTPAWIGLQLIGDGRSCNRQAAGSQVYVIYKDHTRPVRQLREVQVVNGFSAQPDPRLHFGLGDYQAPVDVDISWCGGPGRVYPGLHPGRYHVIRQ